MAKDNPKGMLTHASLETGSSRHTQLFSEVLEGPQAALHRCVFSIRPGVGSPQHCLPAGPWCPFSLPNNAVSSCCDIRSSGRRRLEARSPGSTWWSHRCMFS